MIDWRAVRHACSEWAYIGGFALLMLFAWTLYAGAHDSWISKGSYRNPAGEWCCGDYDCHAQQNVVTAIKGWSIGNELVPYDEAILDSNGHVVVPPDGSVTICRRPDGSRRCVFGSKPSY